MTQDHRIVDGRYRLGGRLGRGGMAEVHFALDTRLCRPVAVKMLRRNLAGDPAARELFEREAWSVASLSHPAIVAIFDTGEDFDPATGLSLPYLVMEFVPGSTLQTVLASEQKLGPRRALRLMRGVVGALAYSHASGIVHQDIKPSNVMVTPAGEVKVMDFGISRRLTDAVTGAGPAARVLGTAKYLSPERARGESADARSDLYSVGCLLYELLVGTPPFTGESPLSIAARHLHEAPVPPSERAEGISPEIDAVVLKALAKDPADRFQSAEVMGDALENVLAGRRAFAKATSLAALQTPLPVAAASRPVGSSSRRRLALVAGAVALLFPLAGMAGYDVLSPGAAQVQVAGAPLALAATIGAADDTGPAPVRAPLGRTAAKTATPPEKSADASSDAPEPSVAGSRAQESTRAEASAPAAQPAAKPAAKAAPRRESTSADHRSSKAAATPSRHKASTTAASSAHRSAAARAPRAASPKQSKAVRTTRTVATPKPLKTVHHPPPRPAPAPRPAPPAAPPAPAPAPKAGNGHHGSGQGGGHGQSHPKPKATPKKDRQPKHDRGKGRSGGDDHKGGSDRRGKSDDHDQHPGGGGSSGGGSHSDDHSGHGGGKEHDDH